MNRICAIPAAWCLVVGLGGCGRGEAISTNNGARGTLRAARTNGTIVAEIGIENLPEDVKLITLGLQLKDGTVLYPQTVRSSSEPSGLLGDAPRVSFAFRGDREGAQAQPKLFVAVTFRVSKVFPSVDGSTFSVVLGDPDGEQACRLGISMSVFTRDGSPSLYGCAVLGDTEVPGAATALSAPQASAGPAVCFRLREMRSRPPRGALRAERIPTESAGDHLWRVRMAPTAIR